MDEKLATTLNKWLVKADNDIKISEFALTSKDPVTDNICFHCQQAVEKYFKLFLISHGKSPEKTHSIAIIYQECLKLDPDFSILTGLEYLTDYAVTVRYPDDFYIPTVEEAEAALTAAKKVRNFIKKKNGIKITFF